MKCPPHRKPDWAALKTENCCAGRFDLFITADKNLRYQQNLSGRKIAIIELPTPDWSVIKKMEQQI
jgi:hypothetical protein